MACKRLVVMPGAVSNFYIMENIEVAYLCQMTLIAMLKNLAPASLVDC